MDKTINSDPWGIDDGYLDVKGDLHTISANTRAALLQAMGVDPAGANGTSANESGGPAAGAGGAYADVIVLRGQNSWTAEIPGQLLLEDGSSRGLAAGEVAELPLGYHEYTPEGAARPTRLIATPPHCHLPDGLRLWGWAAQLYSARSRQSWGIGDLADLRRLGTWSRRLGAGALMINPLSAPTPVLPLEPSPYYPSSRRFRNPIYIRIEDVPGANALGELLDRLAVSGRGLNSRRRIDRDAVFALKMHALECCFLKDDIPPPSQDFDKYRQEQGRALEEFSTFCAIAEIHGKDWRQWPEHLRRPDSGGVKEFAETSSKRVTFHAWLQWLLDTQLADASRDVRIIQDLPIGLDVGGADAWCWQDLLARGVSVGAPPDEFNPPGQDWGLTPFIPHKLRAAGYQPIIETIRATARHAGGLRIDHVMGLFHLFWIPQNNGGPANGGFVRTRDDELLGIIALESERAGAFVVGEDLGTVEPGVREKMADYRMLSYRLMYFEPRPPAEYPELALSTVSTHDLPTIAGLATGADITRARAAGAPQNEEGWRVLREKLAGLAGTAADAPAPELIKNVYGALAAAPSRVLLATLEDALAVEERPNIPGASADCPNWAVALPLPLEEFEEQELPRQLATMLSRRGAAVEEAPASPAPASTAPQAAAEMSAPT